ncbi:MAG TPA: hypothetical protein VHZ97_06995 [Pseudonocardiaceae bacterium]|jgi:transcriptional regulator with XRE-family HTH domain|nr:hypothetical protein [Pseudonocardiaceae bacterium]
MARNRSGRDDEQIPSEELLATSDRPPHELTFGERLNFLWTVVRPRADEDPQAWRRAEAAGRRGSAEDLDAQGRPQYTNTWVAQQLAERYDVHITPSYLGKLRRAADPNIGLSVLRALAQFFMVDTAFLLPATTAADRAKITGIRDDLLAFVSGRTAVDALLPASNGLAIELRLPGVTTNDEAQRQVAVALAQWLEDQRAPGGGSPPPGAGAQ